MNVALGLTDTIFFPRNECALVYTSHAAPCEEHHYVCMVPYKYIYVQQHALDIKMHFFFALMMGLTYRPPRVMFRKLTKDSNILR